MAEKNAFRDVKNSDFGEQMGFRKRILKIFSEIFESGNETYTKRVGEEKTKKSEKRSILTGR